jgi:hypothetical protein
MAQADLKSAAQSSGEGDAALSILVVTLSKIRLGRLAGPRGSWRFEPLPEGALVVLMRSSGEQPAPLQAARVGEDGLLYEIDPHDEASRTSDVVLYLKAPESYQVWWTLDEERYVETVEDPRPLFEEGVPIKVQQYLWDDAAPLQKELEALAERSRGHVSGEVRHVISHHLLHRHVFHESRKSPVFDVTPACVRALFTVEFMHWYQLQAHEASANDLATLHHAAAMIEAAEHGLRDTALERRADELFRAPEERQAFEQFRDYAWRCAATAVPPPLFRDSIRMHEGSSDLPQGGVPKQADGGVPQAPEGGWLEIALQVRRASAGKRHGPAVHPYFRGVEGPTQGFVREGSLLTIAQQELLIDYFDSYLFGAQLRTTTSDDAAAFEGIPVRDDYRARLRLRMDDWDRQTARVRRRAGELLEDYARPGPFFVSVASCYRQDDDLVERYIDAAASCGCRWWSLLAEAASARPFWKTFKARTKPLAEVLKGSGKISKLLGERLAAYEFSLVQARQLLDTVGRLELTFEGYDAGAMEAMPAYRVKARLDPAGDAGEARLSLLGARRTPGAPSSVTLRFVRKVPVAAPAGSTAAPGAAAARGQGWKTAVEVGDYLVDVPANLDALREASRFPAAFSVLAETVNLAIAVVTVTGEVKAKDFALALFDATKSAVGVVESFPGALAAMAPELQQSRLLQRAASAANRAKGLSSWLGRVDGALKIYKGLEILFSDDSDVQYEARHGRTFRAELQRCAGIANIVAGAASVIDLAGAGVAAAGAGEILGLSPLLLAGFSATPWGLLFVVGGSLVVAGSALLVDLSQPWNEKLTQVERALDAAAQREIHGRRLKMSISLDAMLDAVKHGWG